jgi:SWIM/SEC-C metal-binding protein
MGKHKLGSNQNPLLLRVQTRKQAEAVLHLCNQRGWLANVVIDEEEPMDFSDLRKVLGLWEKHVEKIGRNEPCPCGSGKKYKKCC